MPDTAAGPKLLDTFLQVDNMKGFRYLDLSGQVLNRIAHNYRQRGIDPMGSVLTIPTNSDFPNEIRFGSDRIWLHYEGDNSLVRALDTSYEWIGGIARDIEVSSFKRFGMRCRFFFAMKDFVNDSTALLDNFSSTFIQSQPKVRDKEHVDIGLHFRTPIDSMVARVSIDTAVLKPAAQLPTQDEPPEQTGCVLDIDVYQTAQVAGIQRGEVNNLVKISRSHVQRLFETIAASVIPAFQ